MVKILIEKVREGSPFAGLLSEGDVIETDDANVLMRDGLVFCVTDAEPTADLMRAPETEEPADMVALSILDRSIPQIAQGIDGLSVDQLQRLLVAERAGKTRKGVVEMLTSAIAAPDTPAG